MKKMYAKFKGWISKILAGSYGRLIAVAEFQDLKRRSWDMEPEEALREIDRIEPLFKANNN